MTVALDYTPSFYIADGQTKEFQYNFSLTMTSNLVVFTMDKRGEKTIVDKGLYDFKINPDNTGGAVTFNKAPESGTNILIARIETPTQEKDWRNTEGFNLKSLTDEFDKLTRWCQELAENNKRSIVVPENKEDDPLDLYNRMILSDELESVKYLKIENGNLYYSLDAESWTMLPKSAMIQEFRQRTVLDEKQVPHTVFEYRIGEKWYDVLSGVSHTGLLDRDAEDSHPISAITGLQDKLDEKATGSDTYTKTEVDEKLNLKADKATTLQGYGIADAYTKAETDEAINQKVAGVYRVKGSVASYNDLPSSGQQVGDVWNVLDTGANYVWTSESNWDKLSETVDLTPYLKKTDAASIYATLAQVGTLETDTQNALNGKLSIKQNPQDAGKVVKVGSDGNLEFSSEGSGGGLQSVSHGATLKGAGTDLQPLDVADGAIGNTQLAEEVKQEIAGKQPAGNYATKTELNKKLSTVATDGKTITGDGTTADPLTVAKSGTGLDIGDIVYTTRTDNELSGKVECNGAQYNFADVNGGDNNVQALLASGALPSVSIAEFDAKVASDGGCDSFGFDEILYCWGTPIFTKSLTPKIGDPLYDVYGEPMSGYSVYDISGLPNIIQIIGEDGPIILQRDAENDILADFFKVPKKVSRVLVRSQKPTADNNYIWFNLYSDGWCEQGGTVNGGTSQTATFPVEMADTKYTIAYGNRSGTYEQVRTATRTTTSITIKNASDAGTVSTDWQVSGYANSSEYTPDKWDYQNVKVLRPMVQLFNGATDEAVAKCTEVLADVAGLKLATDGMIDYVVESQEPTKANGYTWYRLYKSGWVEQGGRQETTIPSGTSTVRQGISLPIEMSDAKYNAQLTQEQITGSIALSVAKRRGEATQDPSTPTTLYIIAKNIISMNVADKVNYMWQVSGMSAQGA